MTMIEELDKLQLAARNPKLLQTELLFNTEIKNSLDSLPEPFHTYYRKVKKWKAHHPEVDLNQLHLPTGLTSSINAVKTRMMQLKIGGLKEEFGYSSGSKFKIEVVIQAIASGKGLSSRSRPFIRVSSDILHSVTILIDFSSSMKTWFKKVRESVYILTEVLESLRLPFAIYGFSEKFWIIKHFPEKWSLETKGRLFSLQPFGMSPAGLAIDVAGSMTQRVSEKGKIMFVITDGLFDDRKLAKLAIKSIKKSGIVVIGISTCLDISDVFPINIVETENLAEIWSRDSFMRLYSQQFHSDY